MKTPEFLQECLTEMLRTEHDADLLAKAENMLKALKKGDQVCKLRKAIYGLWQAGRQWHTKIDCVL